MLPRSDIPFTTDDAHTFLPWVIGIMACLAALLLCLSLTAGSWIADRHAAYTGNFTVDIPASDDMEAQVTKIRAALQKLPGVQAVEQVSERRLKDMLKPWLGDSEAVDALPLPAVLDVTTDGTS